MATVSEVQNQSNPELGGSSSGAATGHQLSPEDHDHDHGERGRELHGAVVVEGHGHGHAGGVRVWFTGLFAPHSHDAADSVDSALEASADGIRAVKICLVALLVTAVAQAVVVVLTGSVALLADTIHNFADALTAVPLWIAFVLGRRRRNPPLHLRLRPGRGPGRRLHRRR